MMPKKDEQLDILISTFGSGPGLKFYSKAVPVSKQSKDKFKKELSKKTMQERITDDSFLFERSKKFLNGDISIDLIFGLHADRQGRRNDVDNLSKHTLDCLKTILFKDDVQIKELHAVKSFVNNAVSESTGIQIREYNAKSNN